MDWTKRHFPTFTAFAQSYRSVWFLWFVLTALYVFLFLLWKNSIVGCLGLFVPIGLGSAIWILLNPGGFIAVAALIVLLVVSDRFAYRRSIQGPRRLIFNLAILAAVTFIVDLLLYSGWPSLGICLKTQLGPFFPRW